MSATILLAEDEQFLGKVVKESLEKQGYIVMLAPDGKKHGNFIKRIRFHCAYLM